MLFKFKYQPNHTYKSSMKMDMDMEMTMRGDSAATARLKTSGMKQPMGMKMNMATAANIKTGAETPNKTFSFTMTHESPVSKITMNGVELPGMPQQTTILPSMTGECDAEGKLHVNEITGSKMDEKTKAAMTEMMDKMQGQVKFPEKPMAIGETFTQEMPMSIPAAGLNMDFAVKTTYKLVDIKGNMAYFDTTLSMSFDMNSQKDGVQMVAKGNGGGAGKLIYSIPDNYPISMNNDLTMNVDMSGPKDMKMGIKAIMHSGINNVISSN